MKTLHAKSPCCRGVVYRFGSSRRQCRSCGKTWRIRIRKQGRKLKRSSTKLPTMALVEYGRISSWARRRHISTAAASFRLKGAMRQALRGKPQNQLPHGPYALLGDGLYFKFIRKATSTARTPQSVLLRAKTFLRLRKTITCNGKFSTEIT